jgi:hypothetical protein
MMSITLLLGSAEDFCRVYYGYARFQDGEFKGSQQEVCS